MTRQDTQTRNRQRGARRPFDARREELEQEIHERLAQNRITRGDTRKSGLAGSRVSWVRPTELVSSAGARLAGRGIGLHAGAARQLRALPVAAVRSGIRRAHGLPPTANRERSHRTAPQWRSSGIGLS